MSRLVAQSGRASAINTDHSENTTRFTGSITVQIGPQKFETCPDWGAKEPALKSIEVSGLIAIYLVVDSNYNSATPAARALPRSRPRASRVSALLLHDLHLLFVHTTAMHLEVGQSAGDLFHVLRRQHQFGGCDVL